MNAKLETNTIYYLENLIKNTFTKIAKNKKQKIKKRGFSNIRFFNRKGVRCWLHVERKHIIN